MDTKHSEVFAGALILLLILVAAALLLPPAFARYGGEWAVLLSWARS